MSKIDELLDDRSESAVQSPENEISEQLNGTDYFSLAVTTFGVGYIPIAPGTFGSIVGVLIYLTVVSVEAGIGVYFIGEGWRLAQISAWFQAFNLAVFLLFCLAGIWAAGRAARIFGTKDPQKAVVDEVIGQLIVFFFVPVGIGWQFVLAGFLLFRLFDIWKPYPINLLEHLPGGLGVCADDIVAGVYGGVCLSIIYAVATSF